MNTPKTDAVRHDLGFDATGELYPCSWGDWVPADEMAKLEREVAKLEREVERLHRRVSGELSEDCPFCSRISNDGTSHQVPMCGLCQAESERDYLRGSTVR
jgi:hypothetical protein